MPNELNDLLRSRLRRMPPLQSKGLYPHQFEAINSLERSLASNHTYTLLQMVVNTGMTYTVACSIYRLLNYAGAKRILYVLDSLIAADYTERTLSAFIPPGSKAKFSDLYSIQYVQDGRVAPNVAPNAVVCITTLERLYDAYFSSSDSDNLTYSVSGSIEERHLNRTLPIEYIAALPVEYFDVIFIGNCTYYAYQPWRALVAYFDAFVVGIGEEVDNNLRAMFANNVVYEQEKLPMRALLCSELAIPNEIAAYLSNPIESISLLNTANQRVGSFLADEQIWIVQAITAKTLGEIENAIQDFQPDVVCSIGVASGLRDAQPGDVVVANAIYRYEQEVFRVRPEILLIPPLISQRATSRVSGRDWFRRLSQIPVRKPQVFIGPLLDMSTAFTSPRDAFFNVFITIPEDAIPEDAYALDVQSSNFLQAVQANRVGGKLVVRGISERESNPGERVVIDQPTALQHAYALTFEVLANLKPEDLSPVQAVSPAPIEIFCSFCREDSQLVNLLKPFFGPLDERYPITWHEVEAESTPDNQEHLDRARIILVFLSPDYFASDLIWNIEIPRIMQRFEAGNVVVIPIIMRPIIWPYPPFDIFGALPEDALPIESSRGNRANTITAIVQEIETVIEKMTRSEPYEARQVANSFHAFIEQHHEKVVELQNAQAQKNANNLAEIAGQLVKELQDAGLSLDRVWEAYWQLEPSLQVRGRNEARTNSDIISLIEYAQQREHDRLVFLELYKDKVNRRFAYWLNQQQFIHEKRFTEEQVRWLERIRDRIAADLKFEEQDFDRSPFSFDGGLTAARALFGDELPAILQELNSVQVD